KVNQYQAAKNANPSPDLSSTISADCQEQLIKDKCTSKQTDDQGNPLDCKLPDNSDGGLAAASQCAGVATGQAAPPSSLGNAGQRVGRGEGCKTIYESATVLPDVKVTTFVRDADIDDPLDGRRVQGPTVFVYFEKQAQFLPLFRGLKYPEPTTLGVYSFAKVYYTRKPGDQHLSTESNNSKRIEGKETLFNPFWAARLELPRPFGISLFH